MADGYLCKCGARWTGLRAAHCAAHCHRTFASAGAFDRHRRGGKCAEPSDAGLVLGRGDRWGYPAPVVAHWEVR